MWPFKGQDERVWQKREEKRRADGELHSSGLAKTLKPWLGELSNAVDRFSSSEATRGSVTAQLSGQSIKKYLLLFIGVTFAFALFRQLADSSTGSHLQARYMRISRGHLGKNLGRDHHWPGWAGIRKIYAFGDSHTDTGFYLDGAQPDESNPIGNPTFPGQTGNFGPNYLGHLTSTYNNSFVRTYNLATSGAIVTDREAFQILKDQKFPRAGHWTLSNQVEDAFRTRYGETTKAPTDGVGKEWHSDQTLFVLYPGNNELLEEYLKRIGARNNTETDLYLSEIEKNLNHLYDYGARNFLIINNACLEETPAMHVAGIIDGEGRFGAELVDTNGRLAFTTSQFAEKHPDATVFLFDNYSLTIKVRQHPRDYPETQTLKKMEGFCFPYAERKEELNTNDPLCEEPLESWFWRDDEHITEPYHRLLARLIVEHIADIENALPYEFY